MKLVPSLEVGAPAPSFAVDVPMTGVCTAGPCALVEGPVIASIKPETEADESSSADECGDT